MVKFSPELVRELAGLPENGLMDRKSKLYVVYGDNRDKFDLVKDVIALANTGRRRGKCAYLLLGLRDKSSTTQKGPDDYQGPFPGISGQCPRTPEPPGWEERTLEERQEYIGRAYQDVIAEHVTPTLGFEYVFGHVNGQLVGYLMIQYNQVEEPFEVKKQIADRQKVYATLGDCWRRIGESNRYVVPSEKQYLYLFDKVPYVAKEKWEAHSQHLASTYRTDLDLEIPVRVTSRSESGQRCWNDLLDQIIATELPAVTLLQGRACAGKTTTLHWLMHELSSNLLANLETAGYEEQPSEPVPVYVNLNGRQFATDEAFRHELGIRLDESHYLELRAHSQPSVYFRQSDQDFVIFLDGIDEIQPREASVTRSAIKSTMDSSPANMKFIAAGRPKGLQRSWRREYLVLQIEELGKSQIEDHLAATLTTNERALEFLDQDDDLQELLHCPLTLQAFQELWSLWENEFEGEIQQDRRDADEPLSPSRAECVRTLVESMMFHDLDKGTLQSQNLVYEEQTSVGKLALQLKVKGLREMTISDVKRMLGEATYDHNVSLGVLLENRGRVAFASPLLFDYFAAYRLKELLQQEGDLDALSWGRCGDMLSSFVIDLVPRLLVGYACLSTSSS